MPNSTRHTLTIFSLTHFLTHSLSKYQPFSYFFIKCSIITTYIHNHHHHLHTQTSSSTHSTIITTTNTFNYDHHHQHIQSSLLSYRLIQLSHPACNNITLIGIMLCLGSIFLLGLDGQFVGKQQFQVVCGLRAWCLSLGFTLAYGAMFSKIWRVHRLTTKTKIDSKVVSINKTIQLFCIEYMCM